MSLLSVAPSLQHTDIALRALTKQYWLCEGWHDVDRRPVVGLGYNDGLIAIFVSIVIDEIVDRSLNIKAVEIQLRIDFKTSSCNCNIILNFLPSLDKLVPFFSKTNSLTRIYIMAPNLPKSYKAAVFESKGQPLTIKEVPLEQPKEGQVLIKVLACGVCHSDSFVQHQLMGSPLYVQLSCS